MAEVYYSRVYTDRPDYADFDSPAKFQAIQSIVGKHLKEHPNEPFNINDYTDNSITNKIKCGCRERTLYQTIGLRHHISPDAIWEKYAPMGFEQYKLEGRTAGNLYVIECYMYYMTKPEMRDEARMMFFYNLDSNGVIQYE